MLRFRRKPASPFARRLASAAAMAMLLPTCWAYAATDFVVPVPVADADRSQDMWTARWWMWAASPGATALRDTTGARCGEGQEGDVFFLAGTFERGPIERKCTVPAGKHLFFPVVNYIVWPETGAGQCSSFKATARDMTDDPVTLLAELDGAAIPGVAARRIATDECFNMNARSSGGPRVLAASNGYWLMLKPLPKGQHTLHFVGVLPSLRQDITYQLRVE